MQVRHEQEEPREDLRLSLEGGEVSVSLSCQKKREMQSHKGVVIFFKVYVHEWRAAEMKWAALGTASRILDAEKKPTSQSMLPEKRRASRPHGGFASSGSIQLDSES